MRSRVLYLRCTREVLWVIILVYITVYCWSWKHKSTKNPRVRYKFSSSVLVPCATYIYATSAILHICYMLHHMVYCMLHLHLLCYIYYATPYAIHYIPSATSLSMPATPYAKSLCYHLLMLPSPMQHHMLHPLIHNSMLHPYATHPRHAANTAHIPVFSYMAVAVVVQDKCSLQNATKWQYVLEGSVSGHEVCGNSNIVCTITFHCTETH